MSRDNISKVVSYVFGGIAFAGLFFFTALPKAVALDFSGQMSLSRTAFWLGVPTSTAVVLAGCFRRERNARLLTIIYGVGMLFLWLIIAAGHLPVA